MAHSSLSGVGVNTEIAPSELKPIMQLSPSFPGDSNVALLVLYGDPEGPKMEIPSLVAKIKIMRASLNLSDTNRKY